MINNYNFFQTDHEEEHKIGGFKGFLKNFFISFFIGLIIVPTFSFILAFLLHLFIKNYNFLKILYYTHNINTILLLLAGAIYGMNFTIPVSLANPTEAEYRSFDEWQDMLFKIRGKNLLWSIRFSSAGIASAIALFILQKNFFYYNH